MMHLMHRVLKRRRTCSVALALAATASFLMLVAGANAATIVVHNTTELETAVATANGNTEANTIELTAGTYLPTKTLIFTNTHGTQTVAGPAGETGEATPGVTLSGAAVTEVARDLRKGTDHRQDGRDGHAQARRCHGRRRRSERWDRRRRDSERRKRDDLRQHRYPDPGCEWRDRQSHQLDALRRPRIRSWQRRHGELCERDGRAQRLRRHRGQRGNAEPDEHDRRSQRPDGHPAVQQQHDHERSQPCLRCQLRWRSGVPEQDAAAADVVEQRRRLHDALLGEGR